MSHIAEVELEVKDLAALRAAADRLGLDLCENVTRYRWWRDEALERAGGNATAIAHVEDYLRRNPHNLPNGAAPGECTHVLRVRGREGHAYEVGVLAKPGGGFQLLWDFWQGGQGLEAAIGTDGNRLKQRYAVEVAKKQARRQGWRVNEVAQADGSVQLRLRR